MTENSAGFRLDRTLNYGHLLSAATIVLSLLGVGAYQVQQNAKVELAIAGLQTTVSAQAPRLAAIEALSNVNNERVANIISSTKSIREDLANSTTELRRADEDMRNNLTKVQIDIAGMDRQDRIKR